MPLKGVEHFITKLANSGNPLLQGLGSELQSMQPQMQQLPTDNPGLGRDTQIDDNFSVDSELAQGTETDTKGNDEIDQLLTTQMPELSEDKDTAGNQTRFATTKVATYLDLIQERRRKL